MKLISMTDFVLEQSEINQFDEDFHRNVLRYANFLKQPLELWMFIACDENGNVLEEPINYSAYENKLSREEYNYNFMDCVNFRQAKERVLFDVYLAYIHSDDSGLFVQHELFGDGFYITADGETTIEYLLEFTKTLELTPNAIKQIKL